MPNRRARRPHKARKQDGGGSIILVLIFLVVMLGVCGSVSDIVNRHATGVGVILLLLLAAGIAYPVYRAQRSHKQNQAQLEETARRQQEAEAAEATRRQAQAEAEERRKVELMEEARRRVEVWRAGRQQAELEEATRRQQYAEETSKRHKQVTTLQQLFSMTGLEFEEYLAAFFRLRGFEAQVTRGSGDQGVDILLNKEGRKIAVQAKLWKGVVGNKAVQEVCAGMLHYNTQEAWVITPSHFTEPAKDLARSTGVRLIDGNELAQWLAEQNASQD